MILHPFRLIPAGKDYLWGGVRLKEEFHKTSDLNPLAESWECSTHPDGMSRVPLPEGELTLRELLQRNPEYLGRHPARSMPEAAVRGELPILVKFIDAQKDLSVQVHPDDDYAREFEHGQLGKSEMWYVLDAAEDARLIYGFAHRMTQESLRRAIREDRLEACLQRVPVQKDDVFFVKAGTVHAIGAGTLIVEVQESSNLTYRLYDYHRKGADGRERELHIDKALATADLHEAAEPRQPMRVLRYRRGYASELLCRCKYFQVRRLLINAGAAEDPREAARCGETSPEDASTVRTAEGIPYQTDETSFHVLICTEGEGILLCAEEVRIVRRGDTFFVPASCDAFLIRGKMTLLDVNC